MIARRLGFACLVACASLAACGSTSEDCEQLCDWWSGYCTAESRSSCLDDCGSASSDDVDYAVQQCIGFEASSCKGASCCLRFVYEDYYWQQNC